MVRDMVRKWLGIGIRSERKRTYFKLTGKENALQIICWMFWLVMYVAPWIPICIITACEDVELSLGTQITVGVVLVIHFTIFVLLARFFKDDMMVFTGRVAQKIFFNMYTRKGDALSKEDFETIENNYETLYKYIATRRCRGHCYAICFSLLKTLKKGNIEFVAVRDLLPLEDGRKEFLIHVLYVNNGWAFDTYSACQFPIEEIHKIYGAKVYETSFDYNDIKYKEYEEFQDEQEKKLREWCENNNCAFFVMGEED